MNTVQLQMKTTFMLLLTASTLSANPCGNSIIRLPSGSALGGVFNFIPPRRIERAGTYRSLIFLDVKQNIFALYPSQGSDPKPHIITYPEDRVPTEIVPASSPTADVFAVVTNTALEADLTIDFFVARHPLWEHKIHKWSQRKFHLPPQFSPEAAIATRNAIYVVGRMQEQKPLVALRFIFAQFDMIILLETQQRTAGLDALWPLYRGVLMMTHTFPTKPLWIRELRRGEITIETLPQEFISSLLLNGRNLPMAEMQARDDVLLVITDPHKFQIYDFKREEVFDFSASFGTILGISTDGNAVLVVHQRIPERLNFDWYEIVSRGAEDAQTIQFQLVKTQSRRAFSTLSLLRHSSPWVLASDGTKLFLATANSSDGLTSFEAPGLLNEYIDPLSFRVINDGVDKELRIWGRNLNETQPAPIKFFSIRTKSSNQ